MIVDTSVSFDKRDPSDYNTRKMSTWFMSYRVSVMILAKARFSDDEAVENAVVVSLPPFAPTFSDDSILPCSQRSAIAQGIHSRTDVEEHGRDNKGRQASCFLSGPVVGGVSGCTGCINDSLAEVTSASTADDSRIRDAILENVQAEGPDGMRPQELFVSNCFALLAPRV
jgi:hypothetical protein